MLEEQEARCHPLQEQVQGVVAQFLHLTVPPLAESLPEGLGEGQVGEWGLGLVDHWLGLRRVVNNWRSDPGGRWRGLEFGGLAGQVVKGLVEGLEEELDSLGLQRVGEMLERLASLEVGRDRSGRGCEERGGYRGVSRQESEVGWEGVSHVQGLVRQAANYFRWETEYIESN